LKIIEAELIRGVGDLAGAASMVVALQRMELKRQGLVRAANPKKTWLEIWPGIWAIGW
jgi:hypothetical protein